MSRKDQFAKVVTYSVDCGIEMLYTENWRLSRFKNLSSLGDSAVISFKIGGRVKINENLSRRSLFRCACCTAILNIYSRRSHLIFNLAT